MLHHYVVKSGSLSGCSFVRPDRVWPGLSPRGAVWDSVCGRGEEPAAGAGRDQEPRAPITGESITLQRAPRRLTTGGGRTCQSSQIDPIIPYML